MILSISSHQIIAYIIMHSIRHSEKKNTIIVWMWTVRVGNISRKTNTILPCNGLDTTLRISIALTLNAQSYTGAFCFSYLPFMVWMITTNGVVCQYQATSDFVKQFANLLTSISKLSTINNNNMNTRNQGRKKYEGSRRMYTVADDAHQWIMEHGGGKYLTEIVRAIIANENMRK